MISIDLSRAQKIQVGIAVLVLSGAMYLVYRAMQPPPDLTIASWTERRPATKNPALPVSPTNPIDPSKMELVTVFACFDGRLSITQHTAVSGLKADFDFTPDTRRKAFTLFQDLLVTIEGMSDSYKRALSYSAYRVASGMTPMGLLNAATLTVDQRKAEKAAREEMINAVAVLETGAQTGGFRPEAYDQVMAALKTYKAAPGDPTKDAAKAVLAKKVVTLAIAYIGFMQDEKAHAIDKYVTTIDGLLTADQKSSIQKVADKLVIRGRPARKVKVAGL